jgi:hypothetical protein
MDVLQILRCEVATRSRRPILPYPELPMGVRFADKREYAKTFEILKTHHPNE